MTVSCNMYITCLFSALWTATDYVLHLIIADDNILVIITFHHWLVPNKLVVDVPTSCAHFLHFFASWHDRYMYMYMPWSTGQSCLWMFLLCTSWHVWILFSPPPPQFFLDPLCTKDILLQCPFSSSKDPFWYLYHMHLDTVAMPS